MEQRSAIAIHHTATTTEAWDAGAMIKRMGEPTAAELKLMHAWMETDGDPEAKSSYKFPHHMVAENGSIGAANIKACSSAIGALNGARTPTTIPASDRPGVHSHIAAHMMDADIEPPELKSQKKSINPLLIEHRSFELEELRISQDEGEPTKIVGYAAIFNALSTPMMGFREKIAPGAFKKTINEADIRALWNHNPDYVLGRTKSKTLKLAEDERGLAIEIIPPDTTWAKDLMISMERGDVNQMSFGFQTVKDQWEKLENGSIRTLLEVKLLDVSPVTFPAYPQTEALIRSTIEALRYYLPSEPILDDHSDESTEEPDEPRQHSLDLLRRRLELAIKT